MFQAGAAASEVMPMRVCYALLLLSLLNLPAQAADSKVIDADAGFPEGPLMKDGTLYYAQYGAHKVNRWDGAASSVLWSKDGCGPSAVIAMGDGFAVTCYDSGEMVRISATGETIDAQAKDSSGAALVGPNDGTPDGKGGIYFTTSGPWESAPIVGRVLHMAPDGTIHEVANDLHYANGVALAPDGQRLYVNESEAGRVISFKVEAEGTLTDRRLFVRLSALDEPPDAYPDGIKFAPDGNLYIGLYSAGRIVVADKDGKLVRKIEVPSAAAPNLTFSADGKTIYVMSVDDTSAAPYKGKVYAVEVQ
jgi:gluconolactonase